DGILNLPCRLAPWSALAPPPRGASKVAIQARQWRHQVQQKQRNRTPRTGPWLPPRPLQGAIRGRIVAGGDLLSHKVKTRFALFEARSQACAGAPRACGGGRVPPQVCRLKTAESCAD